MRRQFWCSPHASTLNRIVGLFPKQRPVVPTKVYERQDLRVTEMITDDFQTGVWIAKGGRAHLNHPPQLATHHERPVRCPEFVPALCTALPLGEVQAVKTLLGGDVPVVVVRVMAGFPKLLRHRPAPWPHQLTELRLVTLTGIEIKREKRLINSEYAGVVEIGGDRLPGLSQRYWRIVPEQQPVRSRRLGDEVKRESPPIEQVEQGRALGDVVVEEDRRVAFPPITPATTVHERDPIAKRPPTPYPQALKAYLKPAVRRIPDAITAPCMPAWSLLPPAIGNIAAAECLVDVLLHN